MKKINIDAARIFLKKKAPYLKSFVTAVIILLVLSLAIRYIWNVAKTADYFRITSIQVKEAHVGVADLSYLKGRNIFSIDLEREARYILRFLPDCKKVVLIRLLPNTLHAIFIKRKPVALVKLYRYFLVDDEGMLFDAVTQEKMLGLPLILGLETKIFGPKPGRKYEVKQLGAALRLIKELERNRVMRNMPMKSLDVRNDDFISFSLALPVRILAPQSQLQAQKPEIMEIKISGENIKEKIALLTSVVLQSKSDLTRIRYIDLRFKEPVINFKDVQEN